MHLFESNELMVVKYSLKKIKAFTLAEVLITLGVIGVVAAITIPALVQNIQDQEFKTAFKKEYTTITEAYTNFYQDYQDQCVWGNIYWYFPDYFLHGKVDRGASGYSSMWYPIQTYKKTGNVSTPYPDSNANEVYVQLNDGALLCWRWTWCPGSPEYLTCLVFVDVNGPKPPNIEARDVFILSLSNKGRTFPGWVDFATTPPTQLFGCSGNDYTNCADYVIKGINY